MGGPPWGPTVTLQGCPPGPIPTSPFFFVPCQERRRPWSDLMALHVQGDKKNFSQVEWICFAAGGESCNLAKLFWRTLHRGEQNVLKGFVDFIQPLKICQFMVKEAESQWNIGGKLMRGLVSLLSRCFVCLFSQSCFLSRKCVCILSMQQPKFSPPLTPIFPDIRRVRVHSLSPLPATADRCP